MIPECLKYEDQIDPSFRKGKRKPVKTVRALINELKQLPPNLPLEGDWTSSMVVSVTNVNGIKLACTIGDDDDE